MLTSRRQARLGIVLTIDVAEATKCFANGRVAAIRGHRAILTISRYLRTSTRFRSQFRGRETMEQRNYTDPCEYQARVERVKVVGAKTPSFNRTGLEIYQNSVSS